MRSLCPSILGPSPVLLQPPAELAYAHLEAMEGRMPQCKMSKHDN